MSNINLPMPVALTGAGLCLLGGYLVGVVVGPTPASQTTAEVLSWNARSGELCLTGDAVLGLQGEQGGVLCGTWRRIDAGSEPSQGDRFRFVTLSNTDAGDEKPAIFIYGDVVD